MGKLHDLEPTIGAGFLASDQVAHTLHENLPAAAGYRVEPGAHELTNHVACVHAERLREEVDFRWGKAVDVNRMIGFYIPQKIEIPLEWDVRIVPALHEDLYRAYLLRLVDFPADVLVRQRPTLRVLWSAIEGAETAISNADVRVIDVPVNDERYDVARMLLPPNAIRLGAELEERRVGIEVEEVHVVSGAERGALGVRERQAAGRKANEPFGTRPANTKRRKNSVRPARW